MSVKAELTAKIPSKELEVTCSFQNPENLAEAQEMFGDQVFDIFMRQLNVARQSVMRSGLEDGKDAAGIQAEMDAWVPGQRRAATPVDPVQSIKSKLATANPEEKKALLAELKELFTA